MSTIVRICKNSLIANICLALVSMFMLAIAIQNVSFTDSAEAIQPRHATICGIFDEETDAWRYDIDCQPLGRFLDCEAGMVCYAGSAGLSCLPAGQTTLPFDRLCRQR